MINSAIMLQVAVSMTSYVSKKCMEMQANTTGNKNGIWSESFVGSSPSSKETSPKSSTLNETDCSSTSLSTSLSASTSTSATAPFLSESESESESLAIQGEGGSGVDKSKFKHQSDLNENQPYGEKQEHREEPIEVHDPITPFVPIPSSEGWKWFDESSMKCIRVAGGNLSSTSPLIIFKQDLRPPSGTVRCLSNCLVINEKESIACRIVGVMVHLGFMQSGGEI